MSGGEIKMLATVSESTYTRLYRELLAIPERKRVKRLIALAQIGQIAEMAAMGHQLLPGLDLPSPRRAMTDDSGAHNAHRAEKPAIQNEPLVVHPQKPANPVPAEQESPVAESVQRLAMGSTQANEALALRTLPKATDPGSALEENAKADKPPPGRKRRPGHGFKVSMT